MLHFSSLTKNQQHSLLCVEAFQIIKKYYWDFFFLQLIYCLKRSKLQIDKKPAATNDANQDNGTNMGKAENKAEIN